MNRITDKEVQKVFQRFCSVYRYKIAKNSLDVGFRIDYNSTYGGYNIERIISRQGNCEYPFTSERFKAREIYNILWFAIRVKEYKM